MIVIVGFMGAGKSTVGRALAEGLQLEFIDADEEIEHRAGVTVAEVFETYGEAGFRQFERQVIAESLGAPNAVLALGGGALTDPATRASLVQSDSAFVVYLSVSFDEAMRRIGDGGTRPMIASGDPLALYEAREALYREVADLIVETDGRTPGEIADHIAAALVTPSPVSTAPPPSRDVVDADLNRRAIRVETPSRSYGVMVGSNLLDEAGSLIPGSGEAEKSFIVTHPGLESAALRVARSLEGRCEATFILDVPPGEASKAVSVAERLYGELARRAAHRNDLVIGVGGGVVTDLAGFVASTFNRGMSVAHVPTTLLAQVDAAIGGKTGVNLPLGKNLVGTFHQPVAVLCDVDTLATLPVEELRAGLAEVVKYGFIADPELLDLVETKAGDILGGEKSLLVEVVARSVAIKAAIVGVDETEAGERAVLNYGHTFAHAVEQLSGYEGIRHGEAVAIGIMAAAHLANVLGRIDRDAVSAHRRVLEAVGLPTTATLDLGALEEAWLRDKKYKGGVRFVLLEKMGRATAGVRVQRPAIQEALKRLSA